LNESASRLRDWLDTVFIIPKVGGGVKMSNGNDKIKVVFNIYFYFENILYCTLRSLLCYTHRLIS
jgi:hypothetical protein